MSKAHNKKRQADATHRCFGRYMSAVTVMLAASAFASGSDENRCPAWAEPDNVCPIVGENSDLWRDFYSATSEEHHMAILLSAGPNAGPVLTEASGITLIYGRRYIITALGQLGYEPALEVLSEISHDQHEPEWIRSDASSAIHAIQLRLKTGGGNADI
jgi:hypothetical protein